MEGGEGMVAVVRGLHDSALAVTLLDGSRQYTLMPNGQNSSPQRVRSPHASPPVGLVSPRAHLPVTVHTVPVTQQASNQHPQMRSSAEMCDQAVRCESGSQATDGRYASMYKMAHCRVNPTSPPVQLTEFPPQRAELCPGHGNFEVGGLGSGESYVPCRSNGTFRGGMSWPDRGAVCSPRPSREPDAFANSLRKYPNISLERSAEMVERLITYTQAKNFSKSYQSSRYPSPSRNGIDSSTSNQLDLDRSISRSVMPRSATYQKCCEPDASPSRKIRPRMEESPTRDLRPDCDCGYRRMVKSGGDRCVNVKKAKDNVRSMSYTMPCHQTVVNQAAIRERYDQNGNRFGMKSPCLTATNSVNMEVQAATEMVSREVATVPRVEPVKRTVAVPLSPTSSRDNYSREGDVSQASLTPTHKSVETSSMPVDLSVQTTSSNIDIANPVRRCSCFVAAKSKSEERLNKDKLSDEIMELLDKVSVCPNADPTANELRIEVLKQMSDKLQKMSENVNVIDGEKSEICKLLKYVPIWVPCGDVKSYRRAISDEIIKKMNKYKACNSVYRAETQFKMKTEENDLEEILHNVIAGMPIKTMDIFGKPLEKNHIIQTYVKRVKRLIINLKDKIDSNLLKSEILVAISNIPVAISATNKITYLSKILEILMNRLNNYLNIKHDSEVLNTKPKEKIKIVSNRLKRYIQPTEDELREYITDELKDFLETTSLQVHNTKEIETEIIDVLIDSIEDIRQGKDDNLANEIILLLLQQIDNLPIHQAKIFTDKIIKNMRKTFNANNSPNEEAPSNISFQPYVVLQKESKTKTEKGDLQINIGLCSESVSKREVDKNLDIYMNQLMQEIDAWLDNFKFQIPQAHEASFKEVIVSDLAGNIVKRRKHIELNPSCKGTDEEELEHLRYLIFKWINELVGEDNLDTIAYASDLMQRIQCIPAPSLTELQKNTNDSLLRSNRISHCNARAIPPFLKKANQVLLSTNKSNIRFDVYHNPQITRTENVINTSCCSSPPIKPTSPAVNQLNEEYDEFLKKWVQEIPIPASNCKEKAIADKARLGIYNGIWKAVTKLKFEPATFHNPFYYEDELDDEIEELLSALPKTQELETKKHLLKVQLIERTTNTNELIKSTSAPSSFKQKLVESVIKSLPHKNQAKEQDDYKNAYEEQQVTKLVDQFILCTKYKEEDKIKANFYRNKLIKEVQMLISNLKAIHGEELKDINSDLYTNTILNALQKVPLPHENTIQDEAGEILLSQEIDQWYSDLPMQQNNDVGEQLQRKRLKDSLVKRVHELEKEVNICDCSGERALKNEISMFLEKLPLEKDENVNFIAEEFTNRIRNRSKQMQNTTGKKSVAFMDSVGYFDFSGHIPYCSSFSRMPGTRPAVRDQSSYMIKDGNVVKDSTSMELRMNEYAADESHKTIPSDQFITMQDSQASNQASRMKIQPQNRDWDSIPMAPPSIVQASPKRPTDFEAGELHNTITSDQFHTMQDSQAPQQTSQMKIQPEMLNPDFQSIQMAPPSIMQASPERHQSPCCRHASSPSRRSIQGFNDELQAPRMSVVRPDQYNHDPIIPVSNIPTAQPSCCSENQQGNLNGSRITSPTRQITSIPTQGMGNVNSNTVDNPDDVVNPNGMPIQGPGNGQRSFRAAERSMHQINRELLGNSLQGMNIQVGLPSNVSYGEPQGFSTPQQVITQGSPPRPGRKKMRNNKNRRDFARRRLDLEYDTDDVESEEECQCLERMVRYRRPPVCYTYDDMDMDNPPYFPISYGSSSLITNNFTVQLCGDVRQNFKHSYLYASVSPDNIKSVQTSFSSRDLATEKCDFCYRKIKSQEDIRDSRTDRQLQADVLEWLKEIYSVQASSRLWGEKIQRLAQKLAKPGGEERLRQKIQKYLKRVPSQFSECDEEQREFREKLPDNIIKKLKKMYLKSEKRKNYQSPVRIFRIEVPKYEGNIGIKYMNDLKYSVGNWLKDIPIKKKDFLGRVIRKEDVLDSILNHIEPFVLNRQNFDKDFKCTLKSIILEILNEIPIKIDGRDKTSYMNILAMSLMTDLLRTNSTEYDYLAMLQHEQRYNLKGSNSDNDLENDKEIKDFVMHEVSNIMNKLNVSISTKRLLLLEEELKDTLMEAKERIDDDNIYSDIKENIFLIYLNLGGLSSYQANYFTDIMLKHFKENLCGFKNQEKDIVEQTSLPGPPHGEKVVVFHNSSEMKPARETNHVKNDFGKSTLHIYEKNIIKHIEDWLANLNMEVPFHKDSRDRAIKDLAEDITDWYKYLMLNPNTKGPKENELNSLKYLIYKWMSKVAGVNSIEAIEHADELMERIGVVKEDNILMKPQEIQVDKPHSKDDRINFNIGKMPYQLMVTICNWKRKLPNIYKDIKKDDKLTNDLAYNLEQQLKNSKDINAVVNEEVHKWSQKAFKGELCRLEVEELKATLKTALSYKYKTLDPKEEKTFIRKYEDIIDEWIDNVSKDTRGETLHFHNKYQHIHNLAINIYKILNENLHGKDSSKHLENISLEWVKKLPICFCPSNENHQKEHVRKLVKSLLRYEKSEVELEPQMNKTANQHTNVANNFKSMQIDIATSNVAVYGVSCCKTKDGAMNTTDTSIQEVNEDDIQRNHDLYLRQLVEQIDEWLKTLEVPQMHDKGFRDIVVNDLAGDIIDRHKYLELNPSSRGTDEHELEQLKYQIFKWINKLVGEDQQETVGRASELMNRIRGIPVPLLVKPSDMERLRSISSNNNVKYTDTLRNTSNANENVDVKEMPAASLYNLPTNQDVNQMRSASLKREDSGKETQPNVNNDDNINTSEPYSHSEENNAVPPGMTIDEVIPYFDDIFKERVQEIPLETPNPEQEMLADLARKGIYNGIWKTYIQLKGNPEIENDYSYFEMLFEQQLDDMLDCLPQTEEMQKTRAGWKSKVLFDVMNMLKYVHSLQDSPSFRQKVVEKFDRLLIRRFFQGSSDLLEHDFVVRTANAYILYSKYKEEDPVKANIFRQRLMKRIEELTEAIKCQHNVDFRYINQAQFSQLAMKLLESVPIPQDETLKDEVNEILVGEEIEQWYKELPVYPLQSDTDEILRKRARELLAKKLCEIEKRRDIDDSDVDMDIKHEVSKFLHEKAGILPNEDLNINFMVEELTNRLQTRRENELGYETFEEEMPLASTFIHTDPGVALAPLVDINGGGQNLNNPQGSMLCESLQRRESMLPNPANQHNIPYQDVCGTSQIPGPNPCCNSSRPGNQAIDESRRPSGVTAMPSEPCHTNQGVPYGTDRSQARLSGQGFIPDGINRSQGRPSGQRFIPDGINISQGWPSRQEVIPDVIIRSQGSLSRQENLPDGMGGMERSFIPSGPVMGQSSQPSFQGQGGERNLMAGRPSQAQGYGPPQGPSTFASRDRSPTGATRSTARVASPTGPEIVSEEMNGEDEVRYRCRCMERVWKCKRRHYCEEAPPPCFPMPPCRYFY